MSTGEQKLVDSAGDYLYAVKDGQPVEEPSWNSCRVVLTSERLILSTNGGKQAIPHGKMTILDEEDIPVDTATATPLRIGTTVLLLDTQDVTDFDIEYCRAALHDAVILAKYPAIVGGVVQDDASWSKARFRLDEDQILLGLPGDEQMSFPLDDVGRLETDTQQVMGENRPVVQVEHTDSQDRSVETHFSGMDWHARALERLLEQVIEERENDHELTEMESQVLMALYSGVSPFEMADFVGIPVDEVEDIYQNLLDIGAVDEVRVRTEVALNAHGRNLASEAMNEQ